MFDSQPVINLRLFRNVKSVNANDLVYKKKSDGVFCGRISQTFECGGIRGSSQRSPDILLILP